MFNGNVKTNKYNLKIYIYLFIFAEPNFFIQLYTTNKRNSYFRGYFTILKQVYFFPLSLPVKCYGYFPPKLSPFSAKVIFYPQESHYLASPSPLSSSLQLLRLSAILVCHSNLFYFALTSGLQSVYVSVCVWIHRIILCRVCLLWIALKRQKKWKYSKKENNLYSHSLTFVLFVSLAIHLQMINSCLLLNNQLVFKKYLFYH